MRLVGFPENILQEWDEFVTKNKDLPNGQDLYPEIFSGGLFPLQRQQELVAMIQLARSIQPKVVMEIGSDKGGGFYHWIKCLPTVQRGIAIEFRGVPFEAAFRQLFPEVDLLCIGGSSYAYDTVATVSDHLKLGGRDMDRIDCLFIDGSKEETLKDYEAYLPMMRPGGYIFIHDIVDDINPRWAFYSLAKYHRITAIIDGREGRAAEVREVGGIPCADGYEQWLRIWKWNSCGVGVVHI